LLKPAAWPETKSVADSRKPKGKGGGFIARGQVGRGAPSRLASWPPPFRNGAETPKIVRYVADEEREQADSRLGGFKITRGLLTKRDE
jgi:hypothetical protein